MDKDTVADIFTVKGRPSINLNQDVNGINKAHLETILKQKIEELRQKNVSQVVVTATTKGVEFKPENIPYIPDSNHPLIFRQKNSTIERNAGFQDRSLVHPMYLKDEKSLSVETTDGVGSESNIDNIMEDFDRITQSIVSLPVESQSQLVEKGKEPDFTMGITRDKMHHGGSYMKNEYRPYRPGG